MDVDGVRAVLVEYLMKVGHVGGVRLSKRGRAPREDDIGLKSEDGKTAGYAQERVRACRCCNVLHSALVALELTVNTRPTLRAWKRFRCQRWREIERGRRPCACL